MHEVCKICPKCQQPAALDAQVCGACGHQYRTQFTQTDRTQAVFTSHGQGGQTPQQVNAILRECTHQYHKLTQMRLFAFLAVPMIFGALIVLALDAADMRLRTKVSELGIDAEAWEQSVRPQRNRTFRNFWIGVLCVVLGVILLGFALSWLETAQRDAKAEKERSFQEEMAAAAYRATPEGRIEEIKKHVPSAYSSTNVKSLSDRLSPGMTDDQVVSALGNSSAEGNIVGKFYRWYYGSDAALLLEYHNMRLARWDVIPYNARR